MRHAGCTTRRSQKEILVAIGRPDSAADLHVRASFQVSGQLTAMGRPRHRVEPVHRRSDRAGFGRPGGSCDQALHQVWCPGRSPRVNGPVRWGGHGTGPPSSRQRLPARSLRVASRFEGRTGRSAVRVRFSTRIRSQPTSTLTGAPTPAVRRCRVQKIIVGWSSVCVAAEGRCRWGRSGRSPVQQ